MRRVVRSPIAPPVRRVVRAASGEGGGYDADAVALWAAAGVNPSATRKREHSDLITALKSTYDGDGVSLWNGLEALYIFGTGLNDYGSSNAGDRAFALRNWRRPNSYNCTEVSGANITFTTDVGFVMGAAAAYLDSGFAPLTVNGAIFTQDNAGIGVVLGSEEQSTNGRAFDGGSRIRLNVRNNVDAVGAFGVNDFSFGFASAIPSAMGQWVVSRRGPNAADCLIYKDRAAQVIGGAPSASGALTTTTIKFGGDGTNNVPYPVFAAFIGKGWDATGVQGFHDAILG